MKIAYRFIFGILLSLAALHAQATPFFASKDGSMIWDQATGLVWMRCSLGQKWDGKTCAGEAEKYNFDSAQASAKQTSFGGINDWIVPPIRQLAGLMGCSTGFQGGIDKVAPSVKTI